MKLELVIRDWAAWAPGLNSSEAWNSWAANPSLPNGDEHPDLPEMPSILRRRLNPLGRMAAQVAYWCQGTNSGLPTVFASRYGDSARFLSISTDIAREQRVSPTDFTMSAHNAIAAMVSIARHDMGNILAVAAGPASAAAALVEAGALLMNGADEVVVVCYEAPLPDLQVDFANEPCAHYAWAWRLALPNKHESRFSFGWGKEAAAIRNSTTWLPFGLDLLHAFLTHQSDWKRESQGICWMGQYHA